MILHTNCVVCGDDVLQLYPEHKAVCARPECRFVMAEKDKMPGFAYAQFFAQWSRLIRERNRQEKERREKIRLAQDQEKAENLSFWQAGIAQIPGYRAEKYPLLAVPHNPRKLTNLPERRKRIFRDRLNQLISSVTESPTAIYTGQIHPDPAHAAAKLLGGACALCKGACCLIGGEHAFLRELTIVRVMRTDPSLRPRHILDQYLSHLGKKTYENTCVYQGEMGCLLPVKLRSNACSDYFCAPLTEFKRRFDEDDKPEGAFVVVRDREHWPFPEGVDNGIAGGYWLTEERVARVE